ncbi:MAG TPA: hypothetical protein VLE23_02050 [Geminicoccaceae bacterium]|nr:hypothetical protein [Geminicoccaceae bacterium]
MAVLLAITPFARFSPIVAPQAAPAVAAPSDAQNGNSPATGEPALKSHDDRPDAGILPRLLHVEVALAPPAQKALLPRLHASIDPWKPEKARFEIDARTGLHRGSVGTARKPTGPPS